MSIESQVDRIKANVQDTINTIQSTGVTVPPGANSDNLPGLAAALANEKQDKLTGQQGQVVGFDAEGNAIAQSPTSSGVTSFEGRTGAVTAQEGDYTAAMVGAVPTTRKVNGKALSADVEIGAGDVSYDNSETSAIITGDNVQSAIDQLFTSVSDGKTLVAAAIADKGVATAANATFQQMAANIGAIETGLSTLSFIDSSDESVALSTPAIAVISQAGGGIVVNRGEQYSDDSGMITLSPNGLKIYTRNFSWIAVG